MGEEDYRAAGISVWGFLCDGGVLFWGKGRGEKEKKKEKKGGKRKEKRKKKKKRQASNPNTASVYASFSIRAHAPEPNPLIRPPGPPLFSSYISSLPGHVPHFSPQDADLLLPCLTFFEKVVSPVEQD